MNRSYETLDAIVVVLSLVIVGFIIWVLSYVHIPETNLPIISGLGGTVLGVVLTYAAFRFQIPNKKAADAPPGSGTVSLTADITTPTQEKPPA